MKARIYIVVAAAMLIFASCDKFLSENLKGGYSSENYYTTESKAEMAVNAIYNSLYGNILWMFGDVASDDSVKGGDDGDQPQINEIDSFTATADNGSVGTFWQDSYETIARANNAIAGISGMQLDKEVADRLMGEAKFLRAYSYFNLVNVFGKLPLKTKPQNSAENIHVGLSGIDAVYAQIDQDLTEAAAGLSNVKDGHANKAAAYALLAKSKVFQGKWNEAVQAIQDFESLSAGYDLEPVYADLFKSGGEDSIESIFAIRYATNKIASQGNLLNVWFSPFIEGGYHFNAPTQSFVDNFDELTAGGQTDPRLDASIGREGQPWFNGTTFDKEWGNATGYLVKKYDEDAVEELAKSQSTIPQHRIRYAEVLLLKAEALNEQSAANTVAAADALDLVRSRAGLAKTTAATQADLREAIRKERRRELGFEFHRFFDVMRYGKDYAVSALGAAAWPADRYYFPIPQGETDANTALK
ncbi:MAG: RagB/SusD family nutrient uptake outer membrane protein [Bacteroidales bacterium]|nr:RagB/SusD family nutrient uptake outer membrane protein [Bacteroidales bacterium]